jgi:hypothetical protein
MKVLVTGLMAATLYGQHMHLWQEDCFKNPGLPYCPGHPDVQRETLQTSSEKPFRGAPVGWEAAVAKATRLAMRFFPS